MNQSKPSMNIIHINITKKLGEVKSTNITKKYSFDNDKQAVLKIKSTITTKGNTNDNTTFLPVYSDKVKQCLRKLNPRKAIGQDKVPTALIKMAGESLSTLLSIAINNTFKYNIFPSNAKVAWVKYLDKKREDKHCIRVQINLSKLYREKLYDKNLPVLASPEGPL